ncbi:MAG: glutamate racemase [Proteobacteria bacterium]|nr:glutamate racemase [Pseudomonadota bacterium]
MRGMVSSQSPIGVFDSGLGGLSVLKELALAMPEENFIYLGDIARLPYGTKSRSVVSKYSLSCANLLVQQGVKALVVACNTASALALPELQKTLTIPVMGVIKPGVKAALRLRSETQENQILVLATEGTVKSEAYLKEFKLQGFQDSINQLPCPLLVPLAEEGWFDHSITQEVIETYLSPLGNPHRGILLLGCTHYPLLEKSFRKVLGEKALITHGAQVLSQELKDLLAKGNLLNNSRKPRSLTFYSTDQIRTSLPILNALFDTEISFSVVDL